MDAIVLEDIRSLAQLVVEDEEKAKAEFLARKAKHHEEQYSVDTKKLTEGRYRLQELTREMCLEVIEYITLDAYIEGLPLIFTVTWISTLRLTQLIRSPISSVAELSKGRPLRKARV